MLRRWISRSRRIPTAGNTESANCERFKLYRSVRVTNYRSITDSGDIKLGPITVLIGRNNSGKSALLRAIYCMQDQNHSQLSDIRLGDATATSMSVQLVFGHIPPQLQRSNVASERPGIIACTTDGRSRTLQLVAIDQDGNPFSENISIPAQDPGNLFVPILSGRRVTQYREQASADHVRAVTAQDSYLVSRVLSLQSSSIPQAVKFRDLCRAILNMNFDVFPAEHNMQQIGSQVSLHDAIPLEAMGAGLSGALSLILGLSTAHDKLFIIEEPEDDLHPASLKALMDAIIATSNQNQFLISTHSSTVLTRLGAVPSTALIHVESDGQLLPTSSYTEITDRAGRLEVLQDLGYGLADMDLGLGWLIFEESSAERLIRQYLSKWFAPRLQNLRTVAARGNSRVEPLFESFREMFLYAHLESVYHERAWVIVDGDQPGVDLIDKMRNDFRAWPADHFRFWDKPAFEYYYPQEFEARVQRVLSVEDRQKRRAAKEQLLLEVIDWIQKDEETAKANFEVCAASVIAILRDIESQMRD
jgi:predicted ATPase